MFTGLIERTGTIRSAEAVPTGRRLAVEFGDWLADPKPGESIAVDGCCLTLVEASSGALHFDVVPQTLSRTTLGSVAPGRRVHLERSATLGTLLGGHLVQGHVDGLGRIASVRRDGGERRLRIDAPPEVAPFLVPRGSIAVDGVSLTVAECSEGWFEVCLIPETLERTTLSERAPGDCVNLEADALAKLVDAAVRRHLGRA